MTRAAPLSRRHLLTIAGAHVGAALKHQFVDRDGLLMRMLPGFAAR